MDITTHLTMVPDPLILHENYCTGTVTLVFIVYKENFSSANMSLPGTFVENFLT